MTPVMFLKYLKGHLYFFSVLPAGSVVHDGMVARDLKDFFVDAAFNKNPEEQAHSYFAPYLGNTTRVSTPPACKVYIVPLVLLACLCV